MNQRGKNTDGIPNNREPLTTGADASSDTGTHTQLTRRDAAKILLGASAALALGVGGCERKPERKIISRVAGPEYQQPGEALYYSSCWTNGAFPYGLMIKTVDGRPIKVDGNPDHPINSGSSDVSMQASTLSLYDPDRMTGASMGTASIGWLKIDKKIISALRKAERIGIVTGAGIGPSQQALIQQFIAVKPGTRHFVHESVHDGPRRRVWNTVYGAPGTLVPRFDKAQVILSLDADFLGQDGVVLQSIRDFSHARRMPEHGNAPKTMPRFYAAEGRITPTGGCADYRLRLRPSRMGELAAALRKAIDGDAQLLRTFADANQLSTTTLNNVVADLKQSAGDAVVVAGGHLPETVHAEVALLNDRLGATENCFSWNPAPPNLPVTAPETMEKWFQQGVDVALFLDVNPVYDWPGGGFERLMDKARFNIVHALLRNETANNAHVALASAHNLECWDDAQPQVGVNTLCQPVIAPLFKSRQSSESLFRWTQALVPSSDPLKRIPDWQGFIRHRWTTPQNGTTLAPPLNDGNPQGAKRGWEQALKVGGVFRPQRIAVPPLNTAEALKTAQKTQSRGEYELHIHAHHAVYDGRFANNAWLQELPCPISKTVWDNAATMSPKTAHKLNLKEGQHVAVTVGPHTVTLPTLIEPGTADGVISATLGHGRTHGGGIIKLAGGANLAPLLGAENGATPHLSTAVTLRKGKGSQKMVRVQGSFSMHDRALALEGTLAEFQNDSKFVTHKRHVPPLTDMYSTSTETPNNKWAMSVDLNACVGCNACITGCQAENNVPVVGRDECANGREMHWIRIDRYLEGDSENPTVHHLPMMCQQCGHAPCENVCPVNATTHSPDGLNQMAYNRCVGTRYCSNNCPYKVRRFNFYRYQEKRMHDPVQELVHNPQVTVRSVGVMEKCTFCVQRISEARFKLKQGETQIPDGMLQTACQQACPAGAIRFGDILDKNSRVAQNRRNPRAYHVLEEVKTYPSITYLAKIRNQNEPATSTQPSKRRHKS